jgi:hypothetical protein
MFGRWRGPGGLFVVGPGPVLLAVVVERDLRDRAQVEPLPLGIVAVVVDHLEVVFAGAGLAREVDVDGFAVIEHVPAHHIFFPVVGAGRRDEDLADGIAGRVDQREILLPLRCRGGGCREQGSGHCCVSSVHDNAPVDGPWSETSSARSPSACNRDISGIVSTPRLPRQD